MTEEDSIGSEDFSQYQALSEKEKQQVENYLNRTPTALELTFFSLLWATEISLKNSIRWLNPLYTQDKNTHTTKPVVVKIDDELSCVFSMDRQCLTQDISASFFPKLVSTNATPIATFQNWQLPDYQSPNCQLLLKKIEQAKTKTTDLTSADLEIQTNPKVSFHENQLDLSLIFSLNIGWVKNGNKASNSVVETGDKLLLLNPAFWKSETVCEQSSTTFLDILKGKNIVNIEFTGTLGIVPMVSRLCHHFKKGIRLNFAAIDNVALNKWLVSKSKNQFLITIKAADKADLIEILNATNSPFLEIGEVTDSSQIEVFLNDKQLVNIPTTGDLEKGAENRPFSKPKYLKNIPKFSTKKINPPKDLIHAAKQLFLAPNIVSKRWIFQKDEESALKSRACADILPLPNSEKLLLVSSICQPSQTYTSPAAAAMSMVVTAVRRIICSGGKTLSIFPALNFGDLNDPEIYWQFLQTTKGIEDACSALNISIAGGDVAAFPSKKDGNTTDFLPRPIIHAVGKLDNAQDQIPLDFQEMGDFIYMIGNAQNDLAGSEYLRSVKKVPFSQSPYFDWHEAVELNRHLQKMIDKNLLTSINDVGQGGLFIALMKSAMIQGLGFYIETVETYRRDAFLFGESQNRILLTVAPDQENKLLKYLISNNMAFAKLGEVFENEIVIDGKNYGAIEKWKEQHLNFLKEKMMDEVM